MNKVVSLVIFAAGIVLVVFGVAATKSFSSDISRFLINKYCFCED